MNHFDESCLVGGVHLPGLLSEPFAYIAEGHAQTLTGWLMDALSVQGSAVAKRAYNSLNHERYSIVWTDEKDATYNFEFLDYGAGTAEIDYIKTLCKHVGLKYWFD